MRALYVATDLRDADVLQQEVRRAAPKLTFDVCPGTAEARQRIEGSLTYDVMVLDSSLPEHEQQQLIEFVRSRHIPLPIVILVGQGATPSSSIVAAADECVTRGPRLAERLAPGLRMAIERYRVVATVQRENERLKRSEARLRLIIEALPAGVVLVDHSGKIQAMNLAGAALVGTSGPSDVVGRDFYTLADNDGVQALRTLVAQAFDGTRGKAVFALHGGEAEGRVLQMDALCIQKDAAGQGSVLGVLSTPPPPTASEAASDESHVEFAFAGDHAAFSDERMALESALEEMRGEAARLQQEAESERARVQQVLEELERSRATAAEHHAQKAVVEERAQAVEARLAELEGRHRDAETGAATLGGRVEQLSAEAQRLQQELEAAQAERQNVQKELDESKADRQRQHKDIEDAKVVLLKQHKDIEDGRAEQQRLQADQQRLQQELEAAKAEQQRIQTALDETAAERARVQTALDEASAERDRLQKALDDASAEREQVRNALAEAAAEREQVQQALAEADAQRARVQIALDEAAADRQRAQQELDAVRSAAEAQRQSQAEVVARAEAAERERDALKASTAGAQANADAQVGELTAKLAAAEQKAEETRRVLAGELDKVRADAVRVAEALDAEGKTRKGTEAALSHARDVLQARVGELEAQTADLEARRQAAVARVAELEEGRRGEVAALAAANAHEAELEQLLKVAREEAAAAASERDSLKSELGRVHESHRASEDDASLKASESARTQADLEGRLQKAHGELAQAQNAHATLQAELAQARHEAEEARHERDAHAKETEDVKAAVAKAASMIDELRQAREALDARANTATHELETLRRQIETHGSAATDLQQTLERERAEARASVAEARSRAAAAEREHTEALTRLQKQIDEAREFHAASRPSGAERGRRRPGERLGQLASAMANDLHGIVNVMADDARKLLTELPEGSTVRAQAEQSLQSANRAGQLVRHLLRLSEREQRATSGVDPNGVVRSHESMLRQLAGPDIDLRFELAPGLQSVECDADELAGVLSTLVVTVRGALPLGGSIRFTTSPPRKDGGRRRNDSSLALGVIAEGYGMVSVPTTVCDEVVTRAGGTFSAQIDLKGGTTTFTAFLPVDQAADAGVTNIA